jgi:hypothetical protein
VSTTFDKRRRPFFSVLWDAFFRGPAAGICHGKVNQRIEEAT